MDAPLLSPKDIVKADDPSTWETAWQKGITPWDFGDVQPPLREAIESSGLDLPNKGSGRALVPGCGGGYDVQYLAQTLGYDCLGLEIAETAIIKFNEQVFPFPASRRWIDAVTHQTKFRLIKDVKAKIPNLSASVSNQDFFSFNPPENERFDLIYDHTFFCAIPPTLRKDWAKQMKNLVKPGGYLITIVFPILPYAEDGPPYYIRTEHFEELLSGDFVKVIDKVPAQSSPSHVDKERLVVWRRS